MHLQNRSQQLVELYSCRYLLSLLSLVPLRIDLVHLVVGHHDLAHQTDRTHQHIAVVAKHHRPEPGGLEDKSLYGWEEDGAKQHRDRLGEGVGCSLVERSGCMCSSEDDRARSALFDSSEDLLSKRYCQLAYVSVRWREEIDDVWVAALTLTANEVLEASSIHKAFHGRKALGR